MFFLGLDPGYARLGYGIIACPDHTGRISCHSYGVFETGADKPDGMRLLELECKLNDLAGHKEIILCAIEQVFFRKNLTTGISLLQARGSYCSPWPGII